MFISYLEIYNNDGYDLLSRSETTKLEDQKLLEMNSASISSPRLKTQLFVPHKGAKVNQKLRRYH